MNTSLWNTKLKTLYSTLTEDEKQTLKKLLEDFISLNEVKAMNLIKDIVISPSVLSLKYRIKAEHLATAKSSLVNMYKCTYPNCWLNTDSKPPKILLDSINDFTISFEVMKQIEFVLTLHSKDIERIIYLLEANDDKLNYGGLASMKFNKIEANFLKTYSSEISSVIRENYTKIQNLITQEATLEIKEDIATPVDNASLSDAVLKEKQLPQNQTAEETNFQATISKMLLLENRTLILNFYSCINQITSSNLTVEILLQKKEIILNLIAEENL